MNNALAVLNTYITSEMQASTLNGLNSFLQILFFFKNFFLAFSKKNLLNFLHFTT